MAFAKIITFFNSLLSAQTLEPSGNTMYMGEAIGNFFARLWQSIVMLFYWIVKWILALLDFLQYFVQKLIGLDYWLNNTVYSFEGAMENDILFSFLFNDTVQKVFRALCGVFIVLLLVFTIFAIIRSEWQYITSDKFGDGSGNSKTKIIRDSMKAVALVLVFPLILIIGIISSNAILASLVNALSIDMGTTFGSTLFYIGSQTANKYKIYADGGVRSAVSDQVTFYINDQKQCIKLGSGGTEGSQSGNTIYVDNYAAYIDAIADATKYTVNSTFEAVNPSGTKGKKFSGYIVKLNVDGKAQYFTVYVKDSDKMAYYYYLKCVLQVPIMSRFDAIGNSSLLSEVSDNMDFSYGYISGLDIDDFKNSDEIVEAAYNTWNYFTVYEQQRTFEASTGVSVLRKDGSADGCLEDFGITSVSNAKVMYNSGVISPYFDGGMFGVEQLQAEYSVMGEVIDFMNNNNITLYILDATSPLVKWDYERYRVDSKWVANFTNGTVSDTILAPELKNTGNSRTRYIYEGTGNKQEIMPLLVSYSEMCNDVEMGNVLYTAKKGVSNELEGSVYIMCVKQAQSDGKSLYLPLVNGLTYEDPVTKSTINFKSDYYASNYRGVVIAKGTFDTRNQGTIGKPTYLTSATSYGEGKRAIEISDEKPYFYEMEKSGGFLQYASNAGTTIERSEYQVNSVTINQSLPEAKDYNVVYTDEANGCRSFQNKDSGKLTVSQNLMQNLSVELFVQGHASDTFLATYAGQYYVKDSIQTNYLYRLVNTGEYIVLTSYTNQGNDDYFTVRSITEEGGISDFTGGVFAGTKKYNLFYTYSENGGLNPGDGPYDAKLIGTTTPDWLVYSGMSNGKAIYRTESMEYIETGTGPNDLRVTQYIYVYFDTTSNNLVSIDGYSVNFASPTYVDVREYTSGDTFYKVYDWDQAYVQSSTFYTLYLYNFYTGRVKANTTDNLTQDINVEYDIHSGSLSEPPKPDDEDFIYTFKINDKDFEFLADDGSLGLYDGGTYIGTVYKPIGTACTYKDDLIDVSTSILLNEGFKTYYNIKTTNYFSTKTDFKSYYDDLSSSLITACVRDNIGTVFGRWDFGINGFFNIRFKLRIFCGELDRAEYSNTFKVSDGVSFDYFFDNDIALNTFYVPSKVNYAVILIAAALIIKVLGTSIWGVIKRFYEITLYYLAMPAVASTIPLDGGSRFKSSIQDKLIPKVLMTYGVILGLNLFFVLLAPVKEISNIFTAEDIATSGSYFLQKLPISVKMLNYYVYVMFMLVAFTMIEALPKMVSDMLGTENMYEVGKSTKKAAGEAVKSAGDFISGRNAVAGLGKVKEAAKGLPGVGIVDSAIKHRRERRAQREALRDKYAQQASDMIAPPGGGDKKNESKREDETTTPPPGTPPGENPVTVENQIAEIKSQIEKLTGSQVNEKGEVSDALLAAIKEIIAEELSKQNNLIVTDEQAEQGAKEDFDANAIENKELVGDNSEDVNKNIVEQNVGNSEVNKIVTELIANDASKTNGLNPQEKNDTALFGGKDMLTGKDVQGKVDAKTQVEAITATMSEQEKQKFNEAHGSQSSEQQLEELGKMGYSLNAQLDSDGKMTGINVVKKGKDANGKVTTEKTSVGTEIKNKMLAEVVHNSSAEDVSVATTQAGAEKTISKLFAGDVLQGLDISKVDRTSNLAGMLTAFGKQNDGVIDEAILMSMQESGDLAAFQKKYSALGDVEKDPEVRKKVLETIRAQRLSEEENEINTMESSKYEGQILNAVETRAKRGELSITAWELQKFGDPEQTKGLVERSKAEMSSTHNDLIDGATTEEKKKIVNNVADSLINNDPNGEMAQKLQNAVFAGVLTSQDLNGANLDAIKAITGKNSIEELTEEDKALLGYVKQMNGSFYDKDGAVFKQDNEDLVHMKESFGNFVDRKEIYDSFTDEQKLEAFEKSGHLNLLEKVANKNALLALNSTELTEVAVDFAQGKHKDKNGNDLDNMSERDKQALNNLLGTDVNKLSKDELAQKLQDNPQAMNLVMKSMKNNSETMETISSKVNKNYEKTFAKTEEEKANEQKMSEEEIKNKTPESIYAAFMNSETIDPEMKESMAKQLLQKENGGKSPVEFIQELEKRGVTKAQINNLKKAGFSEEDIAVAYQAAEMAGETANKSAAGLTNVIGSYLSDKNKTTQALLKGMENTQANELVNNMLSEEQRSELVTTAAKSGFAGFGTSDQNTIRIAMAEKDGDLMARIAHSYGVVDPSQLSETQILSFLNDKNNKDDLERIENKAKKMSYYELNHKYITGENKTNEEILEDIQGSINNEKVIDEVMNSQQDLIKNQDLLETLREEGADGPNAGAILEKFNENVTTMSKEEKAAFEQKAKVEKMKEMLGVDKKATSKDMVVAMKIDQGMDAGKAIKEAEEELNGVGAREALKYIQAKHSGALEKALEKDSSLAHHKKVIEEKGIEGLTDEELMEVYNSVTSGKYDTLKTDTTEGKAELAKIKAMKKDQEDSYVMQKFLTQDPNNSDILNLSAEEALKEENKQRIALGGKKRAEAVADLIWTSKDYKKTRKEAEKLYKEQTGKSLDEVDDQTRRNFLYENFADDLKEGDSDMIDENFLLMNGVTNKLQRKQIIDGAKKSGKSVVDYVLDANLINRVDEKKLNKEMLNRMNELDFNKVITEINREEMGEGEGTTAINNLKRNRVKKIVEEQQTSDIVDIVDEAVEKDRVAKTGSSKVGKKLNTEIINRALKDAKLGDYDKLSKAQQEMLRMSADGKVQANLSMLTPEQIAQNVAKLKGIMNDPVNSKLANDLKNGSSANSNIRSQIKALGNKYNATDKDIETINQHKKDVYTEYANGNTKIMAEVHARAFKDGTIPDVSKMSNKEKRDYDYNINILQRQISKNEKGEYSETGKNIVANMFINSKLVNDKKILEEIMKDQTGKSKIGLDEKIEILKNNANFMHRVDLKAQQSKVSKDEMLKRMAATATTEDLKQGLDKNVVANYINKNKTIEEKLVKISAGNLMLTLDKESQTERTVKTVTKSQVLRDQVTEEVFKKSGITKDGKIDDDKIKKLIEQMLKNDDPNKFNKMSPQEIQQYINQNYSILKTDLAKRNFDASAGTVGGNNKSRFIKAINTLENRNQVFKEQVYKGNTDSVSYSRNVSEEEKDKFFTDQENKERIDARKGTKIESLFRRKNRKAEKRNKLEDGVRSFIESDSADIGEVYKKKRRIPEDHAAYDRWNKQLDKMIDDIKQGKAQFAGMSKGERQAEIVKLESKRIYTKDKKPKNYDNMTAQEKMDFDEQQLLNKNEAMNAKAYSKYYKKTVEVSTERTKKVSQKFAESKGNNFTYGKVDSSKKKKHNDALLDIDAKIDRFKATAPVRNKSRDFGTDFAAFAGQYLSEKELKTLNKRYGLASADDYEKMKHANDTIGMAAEQAKREIAMARFLNEKRMVAAKKVKKDNNMKSNSFLVENGIDDGYGVVRYKDGSKKYNKEKSKLNKRVSKKKTKKGTESDALRASNDLDTQKKISDEIVKYNAKYKGNGEDYLTGLRTELAAKGLDNGMIDKMLKKFLKNPLLWNIDKKPVSVQQREIMKLVKSAIEKDEKRIKYAGSPFIPASKETAGALAGKTLANSLTQAELALHRQNAEEYNKAINLMNKSKASIVDIQTFIQSLPVTVRNSIRKFFDDRNLKDESLQNQIKLIEQEMKKQFRKAQKIVNKDNFFKSERKELTRLGGKLKGMYVEKSSIKDPTHNGPAFSRLNDTDQKLYTTLSANETALKNKLKLEEDKLLSLIKSLGSAKTVFDKKKIKKSIDASDKRVNLYKTLAKSAEDRRREFERAIAAENDKAHQMQGPIGASNKIDVFDSHKFTIKGKEVQRNTKEAIEIQKVHHGFMSKVTGIFGKLSASYDKAILNDLRAKVNRMKVNANDFDKGLRDLKRMQKEIKTTMEQLKSQNKKENEEIIEKLNLDEQMIQQVQDNFYSELRKLGVDGIQKIT